MDKNTLSHYGWIVVLTLVLSVVIALATPFGSYIAKGADVVIKFFNQTSSFEPDEIIDDNKWENYLEDTILPEEIEGNDRIYGIGRTKSEYVLAIFNEDYSSVRIVKNGVDSDGLMRGWQYSATDESKFSPMKNHRSTLKEVIIEKDVLNIGEAAFKDCENITTVKFGKNIEVLEYGCFWNCAKLLSAELPSSLKNISPHSFRACVSLETVTMYDNVTTIGGYAFFSCHKLKSINLSEKVTVLNKSVLHGCNVLENIKLPSKLTTIGDNAFTACKTLTSVNIPETVTVIGSSAFTSCTGITQITLPEGLIELGNSVFGASGLKSIYIPKNVSKMGYNPFASDNFETVEISSENPYFVVIDNVLYNKDVTRLITFPSFKQTKTFSTPSTLKVIGTNAFRDTIYLEEVILNEGLTTIEKTAFSYAMLNSGKNMVTISSTVTDIDETAFSSYIGNFNVSDNNPNYKSINNVLYSKDETILIKVPLARARNSFVIPETVTKINTSAFGDYDELLEITIPASVTEIPLDRCSKIKVIYGKTGSAAEAYANSRKITFTPI